MAMPALALALPLAAVIARVLKGSRSNEAMAQDYVLLARLKGMSELRLVLQEALRNAIGPTLALTGVQFTFLIGGTVIVERIFAYPGIGNMAIDAVINRDLPLIQGLVLRVRLDLHPDQYGGRSARRAAQPEAAPCLSRNRHPVEHWSPKPTITAAGPQPPTVVARAAARAQGRRRRRLHPVPDRARARSRRWSRRRIRSART